MLRRLSSWRGTLQCNRTTATIESTFKSFRSITVSYPLSRSTKTHEACFPLGSSSNWKSCLGDWSGSGSRVYLLSSLIRRFYCLKFLSEWIQCSLASPNLKYLFRFWNGPLYIMNTKLLWSHKYQWKLLGLDLKKTVRALDLNNLMTFKSQYNPVDSRQMNTKAQWMYWKIQLN